MQQIQICRCRATLSIVEMNCKADDKSFEHFSMPVMVLPMRYIQIRAFPNRKVLVLRTLRHSRDSQRTFAIRARFAKTNLRSIIRGIQFSRNAVES